MTHHRAINDTRTYTIRNNDAEPRTVLIEHPDGAGYRLTIATEPAEATGAAFRYRVPAPSRQTVAFPVAETRPQATTFTVSNLTSTDIARFSGEGSLRTEVEAALRQILARKSVVDTYDAEAATVKDSPEERALVQRYTLQLEEQASPLAKIEKLQAALAAKIEQAEQELKEEVCRLRFDVTR